MKNTYLSALWKKWNINIKHLEENFRVYYLLCHASFGSKRIEKKEDIDECIDGMKLEEADFISFVEMFDHQS